MSPAHVIDTQRLATLAHAWERDMIRFLRDLRTAPSRPERIRQEMEKSGLADIRPEGPAGMMGRVGMGKHAIAMPPADELAALVSAVYAAKLIDELGMYHDFTLWIGGAPAGVVPHVHLALTPTNLRIYPAAGLEESHFLVRAAIETYETLFELPPVVAKRPSEGLATVPTVAFGPGAPGVADENVPVHQIIKAAQFYAAFPAIFADTVMHR